MLKLEKGLVQIYFGDGKGKTTAALGTAVRALGRGFKIHLVQFMKSKETGELVSLKKFSNFSFRQFGADKWYKEGDKESIAEHKKAAEDALAYLKTCLTKDYDIIIADEILYAVQFSLISENDVIKLIKDKPKEKELILTGSHKPFPEIFKFADLITEMKKIKHPFDRGIAARKGIEY
jgi:cob(I)alamin adenosyltransferase